MRKLLPMAKLVEQKQLIAISEPLAHDGCVLFLQFLLTIYDVMDNYYEYCDINY